MTNKNLLLCPVCGQTLFEKGKSLVCESGHCFDIAREGYVNLLSGSKNGSLVGDNRQMAEARRDFLNKGYFSALSEGLCKILSSFGKPDPKVLDICCGEGYYSEQVKSRLACRLWGFDISKQMVRLAAKRKLGADFFVANLSHIPLPDESIDIGFHLFAPFHEAEFSRILKKDGKLVSVVPEKTIFFRSRRRYTTARTKTMKSCPKQSFSALKGRKKSVQKSVWAAMRTSPRCFK